MVCFCGVKNLFVQAFYEQHRVEVLKKYDHFKIGKVFSD